jgi:amino acid adenylation domain-containing protein
VVLGGKAENDAASVTLEDVHSCLDRFDVRLRCVRRGDTLVTELHHDSRRLTAAAAGRLTSQLHVLIATALADPSQEVDLIDLLDEAEKQRVLVAFNETAPVDAPPLCMHELIGEQAERTPDAIALIGEAGEFTYAQLEARAERLADHLASLGVRRETRVGLCLERSPDLIVGLLAILKAGAAYVPMDPAYPSDRLAFMLEDTAASVVVTTRHHAGSLSGPTLAFADDESSWCGEETVPRATTDPDGAAYVIYTSGSTGRPKGVVVTHRNLVSSTWARTVYYREPVTRFLLVSSHAFDSSVAGIFWSLAQGAALVLPDEQAVRDVEHLASLIEMHAVTHTLCLPALWKLLLDQTEPERLASMRTVILAGEVCTASVTQAHHRRLPGCALFNEYGPTEGTVWSSVHEIAEPVHGAVPIGRPIPGATVYLLDGSGRPTPVGVAGELHVGGPGVARGYLDRPDLNSERFVPDPFSSESGARLYRTGDLARWRDDGVLEFLGRLDHQIKIRGYRVELAEIETRLAQAPGVSEVAVVDRDESDGDKRIVAYVVPQEKPGPGAGELRRALEQSLPEYMIPSAFVSLDDLPRMPNGKVDRHSLPEPGSGRSDVLDDFVAPATQLEKRIAARWREVLDVEEVGVHDGFFHLGGNSIRAAILINKLRGDLGDVLRVADLFEKPRISELVALLAERSPEIAGQDTAGVSTIERVVESQGAIEARVDGMSDDEVRRLLADLMPGGGETGR